MTTAQRETLQPALGRTPSSRSSSFNLKCCFSADDGANVEERAASTSKVGAGDMAGAPTNAGVITMATSMDGDQHTGSVTGASSAAAVSRSACAEAMPGGGFECSEDGDAACSGGNSSAHTAHVEPGSKTGCSGVGGVGSGCNNEQSSEDTRGCTATTPTSLHPQPSGNGKRPTSPEPSAGVNGGCIAPPCSSSSTVPKEQQGLESTSSGRGDTSSRQRPLILRRSSDRSRMSGGGGSASGKGDSGFSRDHGGTGSASSKAVAGKVGHMSALRSALRTDRSSPRSVLSAGGVKVREPRATSSYSSSSSRPALQQVAPRSYPLKPSMYELGEEVGEGASATVWRATCTLYDEDVAVKIINLDSLDVDLSLFSREAATMGAMRHLHIIPLYAAFIDRDKLWMVQPYIDGGSIHDMMRHSFPNGLEECVLASVTRRTLQGLQYIASNGYVHRDVKAANLLMGRDGHLYIADFTIATQLERRFERGSGPVSQEKAQGFAGTISWMAPEIIEGLGADAKADIWSLGMTVVEMAWGTHPWLNKPLNSVMVNILHGEPPDLPAGREWSEDMLDFVARCLEKDPGHRPSAQELLAHPWITAKGAEDDEWLSHRVVPFLPKIRTLKRIEAFDFSGLSGSGGGKSWQSLLPQKSWRRGGGRRGIKAINLRRLTKQRNGGEDAGIRGDDSSVMGTSKEEGEAVVDVRRIASSEQAFTGDISRNHSDASGTAHSGCGSSGGRRAPPSRANTGLLMEVLPTQPEGSASRADDDDEDNVGAVASTSAGPATAQSGSFALSLSRSMSRSISSVRCRMQGVSRLLIAGQRRRKENEFEWDFSEAAINGKV